MSLSSYNQAFEKDWTLLAKEICRKVLDLPEAKEMKKSLSQNGFLTQTDKQDFAFMVNRVKYDVIYEKYGRPGTQTFDEFNARWKAWFNDKEREYVGYWDRSLSSEEYVVLGKIPDPEKFLI